MKNKTEQLKELFRKWYSEQEKSDFENSNHFSVDGLIKADDEDCVVLFVLAEPHSTEDHKYNLVFWFRRIWEDYDELCKDSGRNAKAGIKKYKNRIELCATALGVKEIPHGIAVMDMKNAGLVQPYQEKFLLNQSTTSFTLYANKTPCVSSTGQNLPQTDKNFYTLRQTPCLSRTYNKKRGHKPTTL